MDDGWCMMHDGWWMMDMDDGWWMMDDGWWMMMMDDDDDTWYMIIPEILNNLWQFHRCGKWFRLLGYLPSRNVKMAILQRIGTVVSTQLHQPTNEQPQVRVNDHELSGSWNVHTTSCHWWIEREYMCMYIYICIWVNYNISLTWIKVIWGWFPLLIMISSEVAVRSL